MNKLYEDIKEAYPYIYKQLYDTVIRLFFEGKTYDCSLVEVEKIGHLWICKHTGFDTLSWEPYDKTRKHKTGQYEIAVRIRCGKSDDDYYKLPGYVANNGHINGKGTGGH